MIFFALFGQGPEGSSGHGSVSSERNTSGERIVRVVRYSAVPHCHPVVDAPHLMDSIEFVQL